MRGWIRRGWLAGLAAWALVALAACRTAPARTGQPPATPTVTPTLSPTPTATPLLSPSPTPTVRGMPVDTTPAPSIYDRTPGVLHEEKGKPLKPAATNTPTPRLP